MVDGNKLYVHSPGGIIYIPIILQNLYYIFAQIDCRTFPLFIDPYLLHLNFSYSAA